MEEVGGKKEPLRWRRKNEGQSGSRCLSEAANSSGAGSQGAQLPDSGARALGRVQFACVNAAPVRGLIRHAHAQMHVLGPLLLFPTELHYSSCVEQATC